MRPRVLGVRIYNQSRFDNSQIQQLLRFSNSIWKRYGVAFEASDAGDAVAVVLNHERAPLLGHVDAPVLGTTLFSEGHATPYIHLSLADAQASANADQSGPRPFMSNPEGMRELLLERMLGVALAHEFGHYLLDTREHSSDGLLQRMLRLRDMQEADPNYLTLTAGQQRQLCLRSTPPAVH